MISDFQNGHHGVIVQSHAEVGSKHQGESAAFQMVVVGAVDKQETAIQHHVLVYPPVLMSCI